MKRRNYFYLATNFPQERWVEDLEKDDSWHKYVGTKCWPYTLAEARKMCRERGYKFIYKIGLPLYNYIETKK